tara:strand:+ start:12775 stop:13245 length:471 start_codon:yes stop_codon:yes gene_type:complete
MIEIRQMHRFDVKNVAEAGKLMHAEGVFGNADYDKKKVTRMLDDYRANDDKLALVADYDDGVNEGAAIIGWFLANLGNHYFGNSSVAIEQNMFVHPLHRGGPTATHFMNKFDHWARYKEADFMLFMPCNNGVRDGWKRFARTHGYNQTGYIFQKEL